MNEKLNAKWTDDCCGKKDYDAPIIAISTRYWPRGGGYFTTTIEPGKPIILEGDDKRPEIKPSANCSLVLVVKQEGYDPGDQICLVEQQFEGETFEEVSGQVEAWAQNVMDRVVKAVKHEF